MTIVTKSSKNQSHLQLLITNQNQTVANFLQITSYALIIVAFKTHVSVFSKPESHSTCFSISSKHHRSIFITVYLVLSETQVVYSCKIIKTQLSLNENQPE